MVLRELFVKLGLNTDSASFAEGFAAVELIKEGLHGIVHAAKEVVLGFAEQIKATAESGDHMKKLAQSTGVGAETLQKLGYAADLADVSTEELSTSLFHLARTGVKDIQGEILKLADRFSTMKDGGEKTKIAMEKFGRAGARMIPFLNQGRGAIGDLMKEAEELGIVMGEEDLNASEEFNDSMKTLSYAFIGFRNAAVLPLLKPLTEFVGIIKDWVKNLRKIKIDMKEVVGWVKVAALAIASGLTVALIANSAAVAGALGWYAALGIAAVVAAVKATAAWIATVAPLALAAVGVAFLILLIQDLYTYFTGGKSVIGDMIDGWKTMFADFGDFFHFFWEWVKHIVGGVADWIGEKISALAGWIFEKLTGAFKTALEYIPGGKFVTEHLFSGAAASPTAAAQQSVAAQPGTTQVSNQFKADFTVNAAPGQNPQEVANAVRDQMEQFHGDRLREAEAGVH